MGLMTFDKYSYNDNLYLLFDRDANEECLDEDIFRCLINSNCGSSIAGIITCTKGEHGVSCSELLDLDGRRQYPTEEAISIFHYYMNGTQAERACINAPLCKGCQATDLAECEQCIRKTGRVYLEHKIQA